MEFGDFFDKIDQDLSQKVKELQKKQQQLIDKQKQLSETKEKVKTFLESAQELQKIISFNPQLLAVVKLELDHLFNNESSALPPTSKPNESQQKLEKKTESVVKKEVKSEPKLPELNLENAEEETIKVFKFVDAKGKNTSF